MDSSTSSGDAILCTSGDSTSTLLYAFFPWREEGLNIDSLCSSSSSLDKQPGSVTMVEKGRSEGLKPASEDSIAG
jgi:hypothetical protein